MMNKNQYLTIKKSLIKISEIKILFNKTDMYDDSVNIDDIPIYEEPNILLYSKETNGDEFINIYPSVRILITSYKTISENKYQKLPQNIEYIVCNNKIYKTKEEIQMIDFMSKDYFIDYINNKIIPNKKYDETSIYGTILIWICKKLQDECLASIFIKKMSKESINYLDNSKSSALLYACNNKMENICLELIPKMYDTIINTSDNQHINVLMIACYHKMEKVIIELIPRMTNKMIRMNCDHHSSPLYYCSQQNMEKCTKLMIDKLDKIANTDTEEDLILKWVCYHKMQNVALSLIPKMSKKAIHKNFDNNVINSLLCETALYIAKHHHLFQVVDKINEYYIK